MSQTSHATPRSDRRLPRGVLLMAVLLWIGAFFSASMMLVPEATLEEFNLPRSLFFVGALATGLLGYGLIRLRRWAWISTLMFVFINGYFIILNALVDASVQIVGLVILIVAAVYLFRPHVRERFLTSAPERRTNGQ
jgi:membrane associated rhomboid family serine protease